MFRNKQEATASMTAIAAQKADVPFPFGEADYDSIFKAWMEMAPFAMKVGVLANDLDKIWDKYPWKFQGKK